MKNQLRKKSNSNSDALCLFMKIKMDLQTQINILTNFKMHKLTEYKTMEDAQTRTTLRLRIEDTLI